MAYKNKEKYREYRRKWYLLNRERLRKKNREYRRAHKEVSKRYYWRNREKILIKGRIYSLERRKKVLFHYGGNSPKCACCGESIFEFLTIDHINHNIKKQHKRKIGSHGQHLYAWLIRNNFPKGFQVLCWNCNSAKGKTGKCPHQNYVHIQEKK